jgi:hypothetical protein
VPTKCARLDNFFVLPLALKSVTRIVGMSRQFRSGCKDPRAKKPAGLHRRVLVVQFPRT